MPCPSLWEWIAIMTPDGCREPAPWVVDFSTGIASFTSFPLVRISTFHCVPDCGCIESNPHGLTTFGMCHLRHNVAQKHGVGVSRVTPVSQQGGSGVRSGGGVRHDDETSEAAAERSADAALD
jgi:hypothetical protein